MSRKKNALQFAFCKHERIESAPLCRAEQIAKVTPLFVFCFFPREKVNCKWTFPRFHRTNAPVFVTFVIKKNRRDTSDFRPISLRFERIRLALLLLSSERNNRDDYSTAQFLAITLLTVN